MAFLWKHKSENKFKEGPDPPGPSQTLIGPSNKSSKFWQKLTKVGPEELLRPPRHIPDDPTNFTKLYEKHLQLCMLSTCSSMLAETL